METCKTAWAKNLASLYTDAKSNLGDNFEVEKDNFITLPAKEDTPSFCLEKLCPNLRGSDEGFYNSDSKVGYLTRLGCV